MKHGTTIVGCQTLSGLLRADIAGHFQSYLQHRIKVKRLLPVDLESVQHRRDTRMIKLIVPHRARGCPHEPMVPGVNCQRSTLNDDLQRWLRSLAACPSRRSNEYCQARPPSRFIGGVRGRRCACASGQP